MLSCLWALGPMTMGRMLPLLALSSPTLTGAIDRMEAQHLVRRVRDRADGRAWVLEPDPTANRKRPKIETTLESVEAACFEGLTMTERRELLRLLDKCAASLEAAA